jgi:hypothetical protein
VIAVLTTIQPPTSCVLRLAEVLAGYLNNQQIAQRLDALTLRPGAAEARNNLIRCYESLVAGPYLPREELGLVRAWVGDLDEIETTPLGSRAA